MKITQIFTLLVPCALSEASAALARPAVMGDSSRPTAFMLNMRMDGGSDLSRGDAVKGALSGAGILGSALIASRVAGVNAQEDVLVRRPIVPERIFDTRRRSFLPVEAERLMHNKALDKRVVCIGEIHSDNMHHKAQLEIIKAVVARSRGSDVSVGMEMFYRAHQPILDDFVFGSGTLASLKEDVKWDRTWGHKLSYYAKILQYAKRNQIRIVGLNVPVPVVQVVRRFGLANLPSELKYRLPEVDLSNEGHRESFMKKMMMFGGVHGTIGTDALSRLYEAQTLWDEFMAESASKYLKKSPESRMVLMAGTGHIENRWGVPERITRRTGASVFTVVPVTVDWDPLGLPDIDQPYGETFADWVWYC